MVKCIDAHAHANYWSVDDIKNFALMGGKAVVGVTYLPAYYPYAPVTGPSDMVLLHPETYYDYYQHMVKFEPKRFEEYGPVKLYVVVGINPFAPTDFDKVIDEYIPEFLNQYKNIVVAVGETGLDYRMKAPTPERAEENLRKQFIVAKEHNVPIVLHTPPTRKPEFVEKYFKVIEKTGIRPETVIIDHGDESIAEMVLEHGCTLGITIQPWREMTPDKGAKLIQKLVQKNGPERIHADTDSYDGYWRVSDSLGVPKCAFELLKLGMTEKEVEKIVFENPIKAFNLRL